MTPKLYSTPAPWPVSIDRVSRSSSSQLTWSSHSFSVSGWVISPVLDPCCSLADAHCSLLPPFLHWSALPPHLLPTCSLLPAPVHPPSSLAHQLEHPALTSPLLPPRSVRLFIRCQFAISIQVPWLTKSPPSPGRRAVKTRATSCSSLLEVPQGQLLLFGTPLDAVRDMVHRSDYQAIGEGYATDRFGSLALGGGALPSN